MQHRRVTIEDIAEEIALPCHMVLTILTKESCITKITASGRLYISESGWCFAGSDYEPSRGKQKLLTRYVMVGQSWFHHCDFKPNCKVINGNILILHSLGKSGHTIKHVGPCCRFPGMTEFFSALFSRCEGNNRLFLCGFNYKITRRIQRETGWKVETGSAPPSRHGNPSQVLGCHSKRCLCVGETSTVFTKAQRLRNLPEIKETFPWEDILVG